MDKKELAYKLYDAGVIAFDDYHCVDCGGSNVLVDSFFSCALEIEIQSGRNGFLEGVRQMVGLSMTLKVAQITMRIKL